MERLREAEPPPLSGRPGLRLVYQCRGINRAPAAYAGCCVHTALCLPRGNSGIGAKRRGELDQELEALLCDPGPTLCLLWAQHLPFASKGSAEVPLEPLSRQPEPRLPQENTALQQAPLWCRFPPHLCSDATINLLPIIIHWFCQFLELHIDGSLWDVLFWV